MQRKNVEPQLYFLSFFHYHCGQNPGGNKFFVVFHGHDCTFDISSDRLDLNQTIIQCSKSNK